MTTDRPRLRIGFVGAGGIVERHLGVLSTFEDVEVVAFADPDLERAGQLAKEFDARAYRGHEDLLRGEALDAVYICVPPFAHGAVEHAVIDADLPFFVEKPISFALLEAEKVERRVRQRGLVTAVGYHWRYLDTVEEARDRLAANPPQLLVGQWLDQTPPPAWWWRQDRSGGQIVEQATHIIDLARLCAGEIVEVSAQTGRAAPRSDYPGLDVATATAVSLRFANGAVGTLAATCLLRWNHRICLHLFADGLAIELSDHDIMVDVGRGRPLRQAAEDPVRRQDRDFLDAVSGKSNRVRCSYGEALKTHRVAIAIVQSANTGRPVTLADIFAESAFV